MVHHSCYLNISFEADRLLFFGGVLGRLPRALSCAAWRVLAALAQQLRNSRRAEPFLAECLADFSHRTTDHLQAQALHLRWARHCLGRERRAVLAAGLVCSWLRFHISNLLPILPKINIHLYQHLSSMANVLPTEEGMLVSGISGTMYSSSKFGLLRQPN